MRKLIYFMLCLVMGIGVAVAQRQITGVVFSEEDDEPIMGATVVVKGKQSIGTATDMDGKFTLNVPNEAKVLIVSYIGLETQEVEIAPNMRIVLKSGSTALDEVIVIGYGSGRKVGTAVGSVATVSAEKIKNAPSSSALDALQGQVAGLSVLSSTGVSGDNAVSMNLHGIGSLGASNTPLFVVDGIPSSSRTVMAMNPNDIKNISILKDASATSIYGSRAANGVVYVTTKTGSFNSKATVTARTQWGISTIASTKLYDNMMSGDEWKEFRIKAGIYTEEQIKANFTDRGYTANTKWHEYFQQFNNPQTQNDISIEGGGDKIAYMVGASQFHQRGTTIGNFYDRFTVRSNIDSRPLKWLRIGLNTNLSLDQRQQNGNWGDASNMSNNTSGGLSFLLNPLYPAVDENGKEYEIMYPGLGRYNQRYYMEKSPDQYDRYGLVGNAYIEITPIENLKFLSRVGTDFYITLDNWTLYPSYIPRNGSGTKGKYTAKGYSNTITNTVEYKFKINDDHNFTALAGHEGVENDYNYYYAESSNQSDDRLMLLQHGDQSTFGMSETTYRSRFLSFFGRIDYDFAEKYFLDASIRNDASSRFGKNHRNATFWAVGAMWKIKKESFMDDVRWVNDLSFKASYGTQGNAEFGGDAADNYRSLGTIGTTTNYGGSTSWAMTQPANYNLTWEKQTLLTLALNTRLINKIDLELEYYIRKTSSMLMDVPYPYTTGFSSLRDNVGTLQNTGIDVTLGIDILKGKDYNLRFQTAFNYNQQKITELFGGRQRWEIANTGVVYVVGQPVAFYYPIYAGVDPADGRMTWYVPGDDVDKTTKKETTKTFSSADLMQNSGKKRYAPINGGFGLSGTWKNFSFACDFSYVLGKTLISNDGYFYMNPVSFGAFNNHKDAADFWTEDNPNAKYPDWRKKPTMQFDTHLLENASFLRLKNLQVGYNLPKSIIGFQDVVKNFRITFTGRNLLTFTEYSGIDPEVNSNLSYGKPANTKQYLFGAEITF